MADHGAASEGVNLAAKLRVIAQGRDSLDVAQFQFIDLDQIRDAYGERWPQNKARILGIAEGFLKRRVDPSDLLISASNGFLLVFGSDAGMAAEATASSLSHSLNEFFLGELTEMPAPAFGATSKAVPINHLMETLKEAAVVEIAPTTPAVSVLSQLEWRFQPVWDVKHETLSSWYVSPYDRNSGERVPGYQFEGNQASTAHFALIDEAALFVSERALQTLMIEGRQALVGVSLHISTLTNLSTRARLLSVLDRLDRQYSRFRLIKIAGIAPGFPRLYLNEIVGAVRTKFSNVVLGAAWDEPDFGKLLQSGSVAVGVSLPKSVLGPAPAVAEQNLVRKISADALGAHNARLRFFVEGQIPNQLALRLSFAGVDNISSPRIWPAKAAPCGMTKWPASQLAA